LIKVADAGDESRRLAAYYTIKRLAQMLGQIDKQV
jgi:hypothetical protein